MGIKSLGLVYFIQESRVTHGMRRGPPSLGHSGWSVSRALTTLVPPRVGEPWKAFGMSRSSWYRSRTEAK